VQNGVATLKGTGANSGREDCNRSKSCRGGGPKITLWIRLAWPKCSGYVLAKFLVDAALQPDCDGPLLQLTFIAIQPSHSVARRSKENYMADDIKKDQDQNPGQSGQQSGQPQQHHDDLSKKNPAQDRNQQQDQGVQRRAS
jgi:hypothetical protein